MVALYTIGALARAADVPTTTVRYYERAGLLPPEGRSGGNYRNYSDRSLERLRFIRAAQANGFTLEDVKRLLMFRDGVLHPCRDVQSLLEDRLTDIGKRMAQLRTIRSVLRASLEACHRGEPSGRCQVLDGLAKGRPLNPRRAVRKRGKAKKPSTGP